MSIKKINGKFRLDIRPDGSKGKRVIKLFSSKSEALQFKNKLLSGGFDTRALQAIGENLRLNDLIEKWYEFHGRSLKSSIDTKNRLFKLSEQLKNPLGHQINVELLAIYRKKRLDSGISPATLNRELITLKSLYRELRRLSVIDYEVSILKVRKLREPKIELSYLTVDQIEEVRKQSFMSRNESLPYVVLVCLVTGARWSEAEGLTINNCINNGFQFVDTKNGHSRFVPVDKLVFKMIRSRLLNGSFNSCYSAFRSAFNRTGIVLPSGQLAHILRHSFASHFVMNGGNIVTLQKILGHSSLNVTMKYAHLAPNFLNQAIEFNPLAKVTKSGKKVEILTNVFNQIEFEQLTTD